MGMAPSEHDASGSGDDAFARVEHALRRFKRAGESMRSHRGMTTAAGVELDPPGFALLMRIGEGEPRRITDLAAQMWLDMSVVSRKARQLIDAGYAERVADPDDARAARITLTATGRDAIQRLGASRREFLQRLFAAWPATDIDSFAALLDRFIDDLERLVTSQ
jgi:DNA-binding MarR family transcriptional regulator